MKEKFSQENLGELEPKAISDAELRANETSSPDKAQEQTISTQKETMGDKYNTLKEYIEDRKTILVPAEKVGAVIKEKLRPGDYFGVSNTSLLLAELKELEIAIGRNKIIYLDKDGNISGFDKPTFDTFGIQKIKSIEEKSRYESAPSNYNFENFQTAFLKEMEQNKFSWLDYSYHHKEDEKADQVERERQGQVVDLIQQIASEILESQKAKSAEKDEKEFNL